ncbi:MAG TPA: DUF2142 domain-containing protein [Actinomycetota bacterium]|nr:DUF2142 domain-containing protein [Actinomycetota bacterium]
MRRRRTVALLGAGYALLASAWVMATPPGAGPDEPAHYVKAAGAGEGDLRGSLPPEDLPTGSERTSWLNRTSRRYEVPSRLSARNLPCIGPDSAAVTCTSPEARHARGVSYVGTYQPWAYVLPGLAMRPASDAQAALRAGRAASAAVCLGLLVAAAALLWDPRTGGLSLAGLVVCATPMVVFVLSQLSGSGLEVAGTLCLASALIHLSRDGPASRWAWLAVGVGGAAAASTRSLGPLWVLLSLGGTAWAFGARRLWSAVRAGGRTAAAALSAVVVACAAGIWWEVSFQPHPQATLSGILRLIPRAWGQMPDAGRHAVGVFGSLDVWMGASAYIAWGLMLAILLGVALTIGSTRERGAIILLASAVAGIAMLLAAAVILPTGFRLQGRHVLPSLVLVPLIAGEVVSRAVSRASPSHASLGHRTARTVVPFLAFAAAALHGVGWMTNTRYGFGDSSRWHPLRSALWAPPGGWLLWMSVAAAGCACFAAAAITGLPSRHQLRSYQGPPTELDTLEPRPD